MGRKIAVLQPEVPHYREEFFRLLSKECKAMDVYVYNSLEHTKKHGFNVAESDNVKYIANKNFHEVLTYNPLPLLSKKYEILVLMLHFAHLTTWMLLLTKWIHGKKIILWGQGISVKRYLKETKKPDWKLKLQIALADGAWIYEEPEARQWQEIYKKKPIAALNNTLTGAEEMCIIDISEKLKQMLKEKYKIKQQIVLIFCARFDNNYRRVDLLLETIKRLDAQKYGFIIIGTGKNKPDFSEFRNVYDFGAVYDNKAKRELFGIADLYFQPGWVGLSIVEAMAYGKPVFTFRRSEETLQCVEYCYIEEGENGMIFENIEDCINKIKKLTKDDMEKMGKKARQLVQEKLTPKQMVKNAISIL